ncbi:MAG: acyl-CoA dehydratase activase-related protein [Bacteroidales bacterium]|jgi:predicted CoA-substrate-specific enzyme activase|nr:acyl-CoA dehydratase activase-related protein [Bacteroidales bacterium]
MKTIVRLGIDIGSTTIKFVVLNPKNEMVASGYQIHHAQYLPLLKSIFTDLYNQFGDIKLSVALTGSVGMGVCERFQLPFVQEVVAETECVKRNYSGCKTIIDMGGEDAKMVFLQDDAIPVMRMSGNCSGGTGAFLDQMALLLGCTTQQLSSIAEKSVRIYNMASRCGVFSKTDVQNLVSKHIPTEDIAASVFHAVVVQIVGGLSKGMKITPPLLLSGGPFQFLPALKNALLNYLNFNEDDVIAAENANLLTAYGAALKSTELVLENPLKTLIEQIENPDKKKKKSSSLFPLFHSENEYQIWFAKKQATFIPERDLKQCSENLYLGIDSGSTTGKIILLDEDHNVVFKYYAPNQGNSILNIKKGLELFQKEAQKTGRSFVIKGSCSTGYGEDLMKAAFHLQDSIVETKAHYLGAKFNNPKLTFVLDIGGQDMKALFIKNGNIERVEINEACSSGCGSFIEAFAKTLNYSVQLFAEKACFAKHPCDLGTRCTVFMNSKVKQFLREGAKNEDIAAGLSYSVIKNCLFKVLRLHDFSSLGNHISVQGGAMKNHAIVRALEKLTHTEVSFTNIPEYMGAFGCALHAKNGSDNSLVNSSAEAQPQPNTIILELLENCDYTLQNSNCKGCDNQCYINVYKFTNGQHFISGNKCEKMYSNRGGEAKKGRNVYAEKYKLLFERESISAPVKIGIPRALGMYENYPFWHQLFTHCGFEVVLSSHSKYADYENAVSGVMSDNICFPAKLIHSHIQDLLKKEVTRIFYPMVVYEEQDETTANSYNCPIVFAYSEVLKGSEQLDFLPQRRKDFTQSTQRGNTIPFDAPVISFRTKKGLYKNILNYLKSLNIDKKTAEIAIKSALLAQKTYAQQIYQINHEIYQLSNPESQIFKSLNLKSLNFKPPPLTSHPSILLSGRPYHTDPLIQHKLAEMMSDMGVNVISEDMMRYEEMELSGTYTITQWHYINRILKAAKFVAKENSNLQFAIMTSFGCGPDAFLLDDIKQVLEKQGKTLTILKLDDVNNIGSLRLRVRSLIENMETVPAEKFIEGKLLTANFAVKKNLKQSQQASRKLFETEDKTRTIIAPYFSEFQSPLLPPVFKLAGYNLEILPEPDQETIEMGLKVAHNEVCFPATLVVGDLLKALKSGKYDLNTTAVALTQTGGQCRATNYVAILKKALSDNGFDHIPVVAIAGGDSLFNEQPGFKVNWIRIMPALLNACLFSDCLALLHAASLVRETKAGAANQIKEKYLKKAGEVIVQKKHRQMFSLLKEAVKEYNAITIPHKKIPQVGIVGEIFLKFNSFSHKHIIKQLQSEGIEVLPPQISPFFLQSFVNRKVNKNYGFTESLIPEFIFDGFFALVKKNIAKMNKICADFEYFSPLPNIFHEAEQAKEVIDLSVQFGEGWLIPAEIAAYYERGIYNVMSLQPFGCIANHIISKGMEKKLKAKFPKLNLLSLDFDGGTSEVNVQNRVELFKSILQFIR